MSISDTIPQAANGESLPVTQATNGESLPVKKRLKKRSRDADSPQHQPASSPNPKRKKSMHQRPYSRQAITQLIETIRLNRLTYPSEGVMWDCVRMSQSVNAVSKETIRDKNFHDQHTQWNTFARALIIMSHDAYKAGHTNQMERAHELLWKILKLCTALHSLEPAGTWTDKQSQLFTTFCIWYNVWVRQLNNKKFKHIYQALYSAPASWIQKWKSTVLGKQSAPFITLNEVLGAKPSSKLTASTTWDGNVSIVDMESMVSREHQRLYTKPIGSIQPLLGLSDLWHELFHRAERRLKQLLFLRDHTSLSVDVWNTYFDLAFLYRSDDRDQQERTLYHVSSYPTTLVCETSHTVYRGLLPRLVVPSRLDVESVLKMNWTSLDEPFVLHIIDMYVKSADTHPQWEQELQDMIMHRIETRLRSDDFPWHADEIRAWYQHWFRHRQIPTFHEKNYAYTKEYNLMEYFIRTRLAPIVAKSSSTVACFLPVDLHVLSWMYTIISIDPRMPEYNIALTLLAYLRNHHKYIGRDVGLWNHILGFLHLPDIHWFREHISQRLDKLASAVQPFVPQDLVPMIVGYV
jgi:hypothetical protein